MHSQPLGPNHDPIIYHFIEEDSHNVLHLTCTECPLDDPVTIVQGGFPDKKYNNGVADTEKSVNSSGTMTEHMTAINVPAT